MKALSIRQPWAWLIATGHKDIENRNWPTKARGRIYIHAGWRLDEGYGVLLFIQNRLPSEIWQQLKSSIYCLKTGIIGEVDIIDCVTKSTSPWFIGPYAFVLSNPILYEKPIPCRGKLGFFEPVIS